MPQRNDVNWEAIRIIVETSTGSPLEKRLMLPRLIKAVKKHGIQSLTPQFRYSYCAARLSLGDFSDYFGWEYRNYKEDDPSTHWSAVLYHNETWLPKWGGGFVNTLLILGEQGVGDAIFFASIIPEAMIRVKQVIYECDDRLHKLLERSLPGLVCHSEVPFEQRREGDAYIPAAELMRMFRRSHTHFPAKPFLKPNPERLSEFQQYKGRIGISWRARQGSIDPLKLGIKGLSLQYGEQHPEIESPHIDLKDDLDGVVTLCSVLDRVVTVPTSVHHFAAGVGTKVEIIAPEVIGEPNQIPWDYPLPDNAEFHKLPWYKDATVFLNIDTWRDYAQRNESRKDVRGHAQGRYGQGQSSQNSSSQNAQIVNDRQSA